MKSAQCSQEMPLHLLCFPRTMMSSVSVVELQSRLGIFVVCGPWIQKEQELHFSIPESHLCSSGEAFLFHIQNCHIQSVIANLITLYKITIGVEFYSRQTMGDLLHSVLGDLDVCDQLCLDLLSSHHEEKASVLVLPFA